MSLSVNIRLPLYTLNTVLPLTMVGLKIVISPPRFA
nr:hypothetical protein CoNPh37_CDS0111 [Staphylococcus phage S-CoN_Ph37]